MSPTVKRNIFFVLGLIAAVWFFVGYPSQDPRSIIDIAQTDQKIIEQKAIEQLDSLGINYSDYQVDVQFYSNQELLESLQYTLGRDEMISRFRQADYPNLKIYYWDVQIDFESEAESRVENAKEATEESASESKTQGTIRMHFSPAGEFLELAGIDKVLSAHSANKSALAATFGTHHNKAYQVLSSYSDEFLARQLFIDLQQNWKQYDLSDDQQLLELEKSLDQQQSFRLSSQDVFDMAKYHLRQTGWDFSDLAQDTVQLGRMNGQNTAIAQFNSADSLLGQDLSFEVHLTSTGGLVGINSDYAASLDDSNRQIWSTIRGALLFLFGLAGVIVFFFRIRARAIDTQPALVVAVISGLAISLVILLGNIPDNSFFTADGSWTQGIELIVRTGLAGAAISMAYFVFFAIGDSITRQHWSQKLTMYDYIRQGMFFNKPVGFMLVQSVALAFILAGVWTIILWLFPQISFHIHNEVFVSQQAAWSPIYLGLSNGIFSLGLVIGAFLVLGGQAFAQTKNKIIASVLMMLACGVVVPYSGYLEANGFQFVAGTILGISMVFIYLKWDFLTLLISHYLFSIITTTTTGWVVAESPDTSIFISALVLTGIVLVCGIAAISFGKEEKVLSRYVPDYVEELAQEHRIKQELQIARDVQQSFLPIETPHLQKMELAAICKPAYETGGDYYDFVQLDDHRIAVTIGDVSGKGIQAAFYMTFIKGILHSLCREIESPAEILKKVNRLFYDNAQRGTFISLVYGIIDLQKNTFRFARAGHNPVLRVGSNNGSFEELKPKGIGIGLSKDSFDDQLEEVELSLKGSDVLILYTDGIVEALSESKKFYGSKRLNKMIKKYVSQSAKNILNSLAKDIRTFTGSARQHDDMTMMVIKLKDNEVEEG